jgi:hypothetical protein
MQTLHTVSSTNGIVLVRGVLRKYSVSCLDPSQDIRVLDGLGVWQRCSFGNAVQVTVQLLTVRRDRAGSVPVEVQVEHLEEVGFSNAERDTNTGTLVGVLAQRQSPRIGIIGTSITEMLNYTSGVTAVAQQPNGTWDITIPTPRNFVGEGEVVQLSQGPVGINTREAVVNSITGNVINVTVDSSLSLPLVGALPFIYYRHQIQFGNYVALAQDLARCSFAVTVDAALGGADTAQLLGLFDRDLGSRASEFDAVIAELGGMNGIYARSNSYETERALTEQYIDKVAALGKPFLIVGVLPRNSATGGWLLSKAQIAARINAFADAYTRKKGGTFLNPYKASFNGRNYLNTADANANPNVSEATTDGVHPNAGGGLILGAHCAAWADRVFAACDILPASVLDSALGMINTNPFMLGTGGARTGGSGASVTGTVADGCDVVVTAGAADLNVVCSVLDRTQALHGDTLGRVQRLVITSGATASSIVELRLSPSMHASTVNGDTLFAVCAMDATNGGTPGSGNPVGLASTALIVLAQTAITTNKFINGTGSGTAAINQVGHRARKRTPVSNIRGPLAIHGAPSNVSPRLVVYVRANASICIDVGVVGFYKNFAPAI